jgi:hypothetical protein
MLLIVFDHSGAALAQTAMRIMGKAEHSGPDPESRLT